MTAPMLAVLLAIANPASATPATTPAAALQQIRSVVEVRPQPGLDVHIAPIDIAGDFQAKMLELSG
jgi:hypothetical protein